jgi:hypothetical protein
MSTEDKIILCECGNCDWRGKVSECNEVRRLLNRVGSGEEFSVGECPKCEALTYLVNPLPDENKDSIPRVIISVSGGVASLIFKPAGVAVTLFDYDVDGVENVSKDPDGERCIVGHWDSRRKVITNKHWPAIKQSRHDVTCRCSRRWLCPSCNHTINCSYEQIVEIGTPHCPHCETEMTMV